MNNKLLPVLHQKELPRTPSALKACATKLLDELREGLELIVPLRSYEIDFINQIRQAQKISPELITDDVSLIEKIKLQPALHWAARRKDKR